MPDAAHLPRLSQQGLGRPSAACGVSNRRCHRLHVVWIVVLQYLTINVRMDHVTNSTQERPVRAPIQGKRTMRDLAKQPSFVQAASAGLDEYRRTLDSMSDDQRRRFVDEAREQGRAGILAADEYVPLPPDRG